jgi:GDPmannose 4,6-dehydratase
VARRALITGIGGQDGSLLAEFLLEKGYEVAGTVRDSGRLLPNLEGIRDRLELLELDLGSQSAVVEAVRRLGPHEVYNLASVSLVPVSWVEPVRTVEVGGLGVATLLEGIRSVDPAIRFFQASSAEMFGDPDEQPQTERTPMRPVTPYGAVKALGHFLTGCYRTRHGLHASSGILFNHESPRRPLEFVTRKVCNAAAAARLGLLEELPLGNLETRRDWGSAEDVVRAMWLMLQADTADDYVVATGESHSVTELVELAFGHVGLDWRQYVRVDDTLIRGEADPRSLLGDSAKARDRLGWAPARTFDALVRGLVDSEVERLSAPVSS